MKGVRNRKPTKKKTSLSAFKTDYWGITLWQEKKTHRVPETSLSDDYSKRLFVGYILLK